MSVFSGGAFDDPRRRVVARTVVCSGILTLLFIIARTVLIGLSPEREFLWNIGDLENINPALREFEVGARFVTIVDTALTFFGFVGIFVSVHYAKYLFITC